MNNDVTIRLAGQVIVPNENGELEFESGSGTKTNIPAEEIHNRLLEAQSLEEAFEFLRESGAYIGGENSRVLVAQTKNGTQIFAKDEPSRKVVIDRDIPEAAIEEILSINDYDNGRAVEKILIAHGVIEEPTNEMEEVITSDRTTSSFEREASNVDSRDITDGGEISAARDARDMEREDRDSGIYSEEERRRIDEERMRQIKEERARGIESDRVR